jgi:hypothetical protein
MLLLIGVASSKVLTVIMGELKPTDVDKAKPIKAEGIHRCSFCFMFVILVLVFSYVAQPDHPDPTQMSCPKNRKSRIPSHHRFKHCQTTLVSNSLPQDKGTLAIFGNDCMSHK